jgi:hypothetical protein
MRPCILFVCGVVGGCAEAGLRGDTGSGTSGGSSSGEPTTLDPTDDPSTNGDSVSDSSGSADASSSDPASGSSDADGSESSGETPARDAIAVAVGYGTRRVRSEDGLEWTDFVEVDPEGGDDPNLLRGIGYGDGVFLAVGGAGLGFSMRSFDGITWQDETHTFDAFASDVAWLDGTFVAAGGNGLRMRSLDGGVTWQDMGPYYSGHFRAIAAGNGVVVAVGHTYGDTNVGIVDTTSDGASWSGEQLVGAPYAGLGLAFGAGVFVSRDDAGAVRSSSDGVDWGGVLELDDGGAVLFADGRFVTAGNGAYWTSEDGTTWDELAADDVRTPVGFVAGQWLTLGWPATIDASADLLSWQNVFAPGGSGLTDVAVGPPG